MMFKQKNSLYYLLPIVLLIWGVIIWRIIGFKDIKTASRHIKDTSQNNGILINDSLVLHLNYRDPFLSKSIPSTQNSAVKLGRDAQREKRREGKALNKPAKQDVIIPKNQSREKPKTPVWSYVGLVQSIKTGQQIGILKIDGQEFLVRNNENVHGWLVSGMDSVKVILTNGNQIITIKKK